MVKLIVGNLPPSATNQSLKEIFYEYNDLQDYKLISNYGFVYLTSEQSAMHAVYNLNGSEYRGFQITVDYVGDNKNKSKQSANTFPTQFSKGSLLIQNRPVQPLMEQRNINPYNLPYNQNNIAMPRSFGSQQTTLDNRNSYGLQDQNQNNDMYDMRRFGQKTFNDHMYGSNPYNMAQVHQYGSHGNYNEQYIPEEEYFSNVTPLKKSRMDPFMDNDSYKPKDFSEDDFRYQSFKGSQQSWYDLRKMKNQSFLYPRDEPLYHPRQKRTYQQHKSYIDEYEDDRDYGEIDPYPAYLKQYRK